MIVNLINESSARVLLFLAISPGSRYLRKEIKEKTMINNVPLDYALSELLMFRMIKLEKKFYSFNLENETARLAFNEIKEKIGGLPLNVQFILLDFIHKVSKIRGISNIILFGSYAKLIFSEKSDIDIAIIFKDNDSKKKNDKKINSLADNLSKKYKKEIQTHFFVEEDLKHKEDPLIKDILRNGREII